MPGKKDLHPEVSIDMEFERMLARSIEWVRANATVLALSAVAVAIVLLTAVVTHTNRRSRDQEIVTYLEAAGAGKDMDLEVLKETVERAEGTKAHARALLVYANALFDAQKFEEARRIYLRVVEEHAENFLCCPAQLGLAATLEELGERREARAVYEDASRKLAGTLFAERAMKRLTALEDPLTDAPASQPTSKETDQ